MRYYFILSGILILFISCTNQETSDTYRKKADSIRKHVLPKTEFSVSSFETDTLGSWKFVSEILSQYKRGEKSVMIKTTCFQHGKKINEVYNELKEDLKFQAQIIVQESEDKAVLYYLLKNDREENQMFSIWVSGGEVDIEKLSPDKYERYEMIKAEIVEKAISHNTQ